MASKIALKGTGRNKAASFAGTHSQPKRKLPRVSEVPGTAKGPHQLKPKKHSKIKVQSFVKDGNPDMLYSEGMQCLKKGDPAGAARLLEASWHHMRGVPAPVYGSECTTISSSSSEEDEEEDSDEESNEQSGSEDSDLSASEAGEFLAPSIAIDSTRTYNDAVDERGKELSSSLVASPRVSEMWHNESTEEARTASKRGALRHDIHEFDQAIVASRPLTTADVDRQMRLCMNLTLALVKCQRWADVERVSKEALNSFGHADARGIPRLLSEAEEDRWVKLSLRRGVALAFLGIAAETEAMEEYFASAQACFSRVLRVQPKQRCAAQGLDSLRFLAKQLKAARSSGGIAAPVPEALTAIARSI